MKNLKKLIPALCLLLISAMLLGTSTFAWFTMNRTVTATGLSVKATTGGNLLIALPDDGNAPAVSDFATSVDFEMAEAAEIPPVSTSDLLTWFKAQAADVKASAKNSAGYGDASDSEYLHKDFYLYAGDDMDVYLSSLTIKVDDTTLSTSSSPAALWQSLRVGVKVGSEFMIYAYTADTADGSKGGESGSEDTAVAVKNATDGAQILNGGDTKVFHVINSATTDTDKNYKLASLAAETPTKSTVFIWFEGEDGACYTNNFKTDAVNISFAISQVPEASA